MLVDSHCHLDYLQREGQNLDDVVARAKNAGVGIMVTISTKLSTFPEVRAIAERYDSVFCSVGIHPHDADEEFDGNSSALTEFLVKQAEHTKVVAIGETGLDYYYEHSKRDAQKESFRAHIAASRITGLPLVVHTRDADDDTMAILEDEMGKGAFPGLIHCFSATDELARRSVAIGMSISLSGIVTFKSAQSIRDTVQGLDMESLLVETDSPYLAPAPHRGKKNEPAFVAHTAAAVAELKALSADDLADATTENFYRLFSKIDRSAAGARA
ncbi:MAG: TatD family hydrolase [Alphaproteobacteria bacterium]